MTIDENYNLVGVRNLYEKKNTKKFPNPPEFIVIHYTGTVKTQAAINHLQDPEVKASAHLIIDREGNMTQLAPFDVITWHAGKSFWPPKYIGLNKYSIGIELTNAGELKKVSKDMYYTKYGNRVFPQQVKEHRPYNGGVSYWQDYPESQIQTLVKVVKALTTKFNISKHRIVGHSEISPGRKIDPGPVFPWWDFYYQLIN